MKNRKIITPKKASVFLEPREILDAAIVRRRKDGGIVYGYYKLADAFVKMGMEDTDEAMEWIEYNVVRSIPYMPHPQPSLDCDIDEQ